MDPLATVKKSFDLKFLGKLLVGFILLAAALEIVGLFVPIIPAFVHSPVATIKRLFGPKPA